MTDVSMVPWDRPHPTYPLLEIRRDYVGLDVCTNGKDLRYIPAAQPISAYWKNSPHSEVYFAQVTHLVTEMGRGKQKCRIEMVVFEEYLLQDVIEWIMRHRQFNPQVTMERSDGGPSGIVVMMEGKIQG